MRSYKKPTAEQVRRILHLRASSPEFTYFFEKLDSPSWIEPLMKEGAFGQPPVPILDQESGMRTDPPWAPGRYLARMAEIEPAAVFAVLLAMPDTDNGRVQEDLADAITKLPPEQAVKLVPRVIKWLKPLYAVLRLPIRIARIATNLAAAGYVSEALEILAGLLRVEADNDSRSTVGMIALSPRPRIALHIWDYEKILQTEAPRFVDIARKPALELLSDLLETAIKASLRDTAPKEKNDYSVIWRPAIEDHRQNRLSEEVRDILCVTLRDNSERLIRGRKVLVPEVVTLLETRTWTVFRRIALYLLTKFPEGNEELIKARLVSRGNLQDATIRHEYHRLLQAQYGNLAPGDQAAILAWIDEGLDIDEYKTLFTQHTGAEAEPEDIERRKKHYYLREWASIREHLPPHKKAEYEKWAAEFGEPDHPDFSSWTGHFEGPTAPEEDVPLAERSISGRAKYLKEWRPKKGFGEASPEGLGRELQALVKLKPDEFTAELSEFKNIDPTYARSILTGLRDVVRAGERGIDWTAAVEYAQWVLEQKDEGFEPLGSEYDSDQDWELSRRAVADLLNDGLESKKAEIPADHDGAVWQMLRQLIEDPNPQKEDFGPNRLDPYELSINCVRGVAMHAVIKYALWHRRHFGKNVGDEELLAKGFGAMPEVREVLERHLDKKVDPSLAVHSVYGRFVPWLHLIDPKWTAEHLPTIFPHEPDGLDYLVAAWNAYILYVIAFNEMATVLRHEYLAAMDRIVSHSNADEHLGQHLLVFYLRGLVKMDDDLVERFYAKASDALRASVANEIGRLTPELHGKDQPAYERAKALWEWRLEAAAKDKENHKSEIAHFGSWFFEPLNDPEWLVINLKKSLQIAGEIEFEHFVGEQLVEIAKTHPLETVGCLQLMAEGDTKGWGIIGWKDSAIEILGTIRETTDPNLKGAVNKLVNYLGSRGYVEEFRNLQIK
jgi:hypothetical protein